jgi:predicted nucleotidyltransferase
VEANLQQYLAWAREIAELLEREIDPQLVVLFGSVAKGEVYRDSDLDLFVVWDGVGHLTNRERRIKLRKLIGEREVPLDILTCTSEEFEEALQEPNSFTNIIMAEGMVLYEKKV